MSLVTVLEDPEPWFLAAQLLLCEGSPLSRQTHICRFCPCKGRVPLLTPLPELFQPIVTGMCLRFREHLSRALPPQIPRQLAPRETWAPEAGL